MKRLDIGAAALCALAAAALNFPHFASYINDNTVDIFFHYNWAKEFAENIGHGAVYPKWIFSWAFWAGGAGVCHLCAPVLLWSCDVRKARRERVDRHALR